MQIYYRSYLEFLIKADLLARELALTPKEAAELLARISGYEDHRTMPTGEENASQCLSSVTREDLVIRLLAMRPDISPKRACDIVARLKLCENGNVPEPRPKQPYSA